MNNGYLFSGYLKSLVLARQGRPTNSGIPEVMECLMRLPNDRKKNDSTRKYLSKHATGHGNPLEIGTYIENKYVDVIVDEDQKTSMLDRIESRNAHFLGLISDSLSAQFHNPPSGAWFLPYLLAFSIIQQVESDVFDDISRFLLKMVEVEIKLLREDESNKVKAEATALMSPHGVSVVSGVDNSVDRLMFWAALDELLLSISGFSIKSESSIALEHCAPKVKNNKLCLSVEMFVDKVASVHNQTTQEGIAQQLGVDPAELRRLKKVKKHLTEEHLIELYDKPS